jgi:OPA family sugar phosphate sensor protein UhpC-like MFS transporter
VNPLRVFLTGEDRPPLDDTSLVDSLYKRHRLRIMLAITIGYGLVYTCRLALSMVKKPLTPSASSPTASSPTT